MAIVPYVELLESFKTPVDRAWYLAAYQFTNGSRAVPVRVLDALGATPRGCGTYCYTDGTSEIYIRGDFTESPGAWAMHGTVNISQAHFTVSSPLWVYDPHYDYSRSQDHEIAHLHPSPTEKWSMEQCPRKVLDYLWEGVSTTFSAFIERQHIDNGGLPIPDDPRAP